MKLAYATLALPLVILVAAASDRPAAGSQKEDQQNLEDANRRRWRGARCRSRVPLEVKKGRANDGWTNCGILYWGDGGNKRVRVRVSDADAVRRRFSGGTIPIGTDFVASGWEVEEDGGTLFLEIELQGLPVRRAKVYFGDSWVGRVGVNRITDFERWARFEFMEVLGRHRPNNWSRFPPLPRCPSQRHRPFRSIAMRPLRPHCACWLLRWSRRGSLRATRSD